MRKVFIYFLFILVSSSAWSQSSESNFDAEYLKIYQATKNELAVDPLLQNGTYYAYPYHSAVGHPFPGDGEFESGSVIFREKRYEGVSINYDMFNQQLILSREKDGILLMNLMATEFVSGFTFKGMNFVKASFSDEPAAFFQLISQTRNIECYYAWHKERREILDSGNQRIYSFSEEKIKRYLFLDGKLSQYKNNRTFIQLLPDEAKEDIKRYLKENRILVKEADDQKMSVLIDFCNGILSHDLIQEGI